jgi:enoyl-CoA hydratase/carnithine racemase
MENELIRVERRDLLYIITLNRPDMRNAINWDMMRALEEAVQAAERHFPNDVRAIIINAEGRVFSSGIDLADFNRMQELYGDAWRENLFPITAGFQRVHNAIERSSFPVIAAMHGYVLGLSLELALACDFRFAAERTRFSLPEARLGIVPDVGGTARLVRLIGPARAKEVIMTGRNFDAAEAMGWGLLNGVVPRGDLMTHVEAFAAELAQSAPLAVSYTKRMINDMIGIERDLHIEAWAQAALFRSEDFAAGVSAMLTKTYPVHWQGK